MESMNVLAFQERYKLTKEILDKSKSDIRFIEPKMAVIEDIYIAHERKYVDSFIAGRLSNKEKRNRSTTVERPDC